MKTEKDMSKPQVKLVNLGLKSYLPTWKIQQKLVEKVKNDRKSENFLILVEHNPVFTTGIRTNVYDSKWVILPIVFFTKIIQKRICILISVRLWNFKGDGS